MDTPADPIRQHDPDGATALAEHLKDCMGMSAAVVMGRGESADPVVERMIREGWTYERTEYAFGSGSAS